MKYIITENKLHNTIFEYIGKYFERDALDWEYEYNSDEEDFERNIIDFSGEKYRNGEMDEHYFTYIKKEYYENLTDDNFKWKWIDEAPLLDLSPGVYWVRKMDLMFSEIWRPSFEKWFSVTYPDFPVKTFVYPEKINN